MYAVLILLSTAFLLFFPIVIESDTHLDLNRKKCGFAVFAFKRIKLIGGYIATYDGGLALHVSKKNAILIPYSQMDSERKRFSFIRTFRLISFRLTTETGAEYLLPVGLIHTALRACFFAIGGDKDKIENNLWLTDGDTLRVSLNFVIFFNLYILLKNFLKFLKEKIKILWRKKMKKSTA
ncbi:MAG: hypothetical protein IJ514_02980 [Clostridia bacterium]|nr:hypothetical protein [Clostridia bacterium]